MAKKTNQKAGKTQKKRKVIVESNGEAHVTASFNNIIISLTNKKGDVVAWSSAGKMGFRGSKKNTPYAAQLAAEDASKVAHEAGMRKVKVYVKGRGNGRESAIRAVLDVIARAARAHQIRPCIAAVYCRTGFVITITVAVAR